MLETTITVIRGAGDLATGVAWRLFQAGFPLVMLEVAQPLAVRRMVAFSECIYTGRFEVEGVIAAKASDPTRARQLLAQNIIPILIDPSMASLAKLQPTILIDATIQKKNDRISRHLAPIVIGLGPGFNAGQDCDAVIETKRGHNLGRVIWHGLATANTGIPGDIQGYTHQRLLRSPSTGQLQCGKEIGDLVMANEVVGVVGSEPITAQIPGIIRGLLRSGIQVTEQMKIGDIDPRACREYCFTISDKALAIGGGVLEAALKLLRTKVTLR